MTTELLTTCLVCQAHPFWNKLLKIQPETLGQASPISGVSPADVSVLMVYLNRQGVDEELYNWNRSPWRWPMGWLYGFTATIVFVLGEYRPKPYSPYALVFVSLVLLGWALTFLATFLFFKNLYFQQWVRASAWLVLALLGWFFFYILTYAVVPATRQEQIS